MIDSDIHRQMGIWEMQCSSCQVWTSCGGSKTAPCGCIWTGKNRYDCENCNILCRERYVILANASKDSFSIHVNSTRSLEELNIKQNFSMIESFPRLIPMQTRQLPVDSKLEWSGVTLADLVTERKKPPIDPKRYLLDFVQF